MPGADALIPEPRPVYGKAGARDYPLAHGPTTQPESERLR